MCTVKKYKVLNFHIITITNLIWVDNGVDAETVPVKTFITTKTSLIEVYKSEKLEFKSETLCVLYIVKTDKNSSVT